MKILVIILPLLVSAKDADDKTEDPKDLDVDFRAVLAKKLAIKKTDDYGLEDGEEHEVPVLKDPLSSQCVTDLKDRNPLNLGKVIVSPRSFIPGPLCERDPMPQKHFIIIGAGIAGLISAYVLLEVGHKVTMLESSKRTGGRIYTYYGDGYYGDLGAMRFPPNHFVVQRAFHHFGIPLTPFTNYNEGDQGNYFFINNTYYPSEDVIGEKRKESSVRELYALFNIPEGDIPKDKDGKIESPHDFGNRILGESSMTEEMCANDMSLMAFLRMKFKEKKINEKLIHLWGIMTVNQGFLAKTVDEYLTDNHLDELSKNVRHMTYMEVVNGTSVFPDKLLRLIQKSKNFQLKTTTQVRKVHHGGDLDEDGKITVQYRDLTYRKDGKTTGDYIILTPTAKAIGLIKFVPDLPYQKKNALANLQYMNAAKIFLKFSKPFWADSHNNKAVPILFGKPKQSKAGGTGLTDSPITQIYYPSNKNHGNSIIASYSWDYQADFFLSLSDEKAIDLALSELEKIHGPVVRETFLEGFIYNWAKNPHSHGAFVIQDPLQKYQFMNLLQSGTHRMIFSAEYANKDHNGFIEAAMQSAIRNLVNKWPKLYEEKYLEEETKMFQERTSSNSRNKERK